MHHGISEQLQVGQLPSGKMNTPVAGEWSQHLSDILGPETTLRIIPAIERAGEIPFSAQQLFAALCPGASLLEKINAGLR